MKFKGFNDSETFTNIPDSFFRQLLIEIADPDELKVTLYALWRFEHMEGHLRFLREKEFTGVLPHPGPGLEKAVQRGSLLQVEKNAARIYFLNSPRGRAAAEAFARGQLDIGRAAISNPPVERPNIFKLYEENIGPLTPLLADTLKDAEETYPPEWVAEALEIAVKSNKRNWKYAEAILRRWKEEGHAQEQDRDDAKEHRGRDVRRKVEDFLKR
jgi:DnaD/phage-associated family protein